MRTRGCNQINFSQLELVALVAGETMVNMKDIRTIGQRIAREFHPQRVILFGSHARGTAGADSDGFCEPILQEK